MAPASNDAAPPAYEQLEPSNERSQAFLRRIQAAVNIAYGNANDNPPEIKRMHNFLLYCLAVDYRCPCALSLSASDREHFLGMKKVLVSMPNIHKSMHLSAEERRPLAAYFWKHLHAPCTSLGIPVESAVLIVVRYVKYLNANGRYKGCAHGLLHSLGPEALASKLLMDRNVLIPHLATSEHMRQEFTKRIFETARPYFTSVDGFASAIIPVESVASAAFAEEAACQYTLTPRGRFYRDNRAHTLNMVQRSVLPLLDKAFMCLAGAYKRHKRNDIFPKSPAEILLLCDHGCMGPGPTPTQPPKESPLWVGRPRWRETESMYLPELFEHRPGQGHCDS